MNHDHRSGFFSPILSSRLGGLLIIQKMNEPNLDTGQRGYYRYFGILPSFSDLPKLSKSGNF